MIKLERPQMDAGEVFTTCISRVRNVGLKARLVGVKQVVVDASAEFDEAAAHTRLHTLAPHDMVGNVVTQAEMEAVYTARMAKKGAPGRDIYDTLLTSSPQGKCPLCGHRTVSTLDHHLPKVHYPVLAVAPLNLVPACSDCNKSKLAGLPLTAEEETLHPYFDDIDDERWLVAEVIPSTPPALQFSVVPPEAWDEMLSARVKQHFRVFGLASLYASQAADELLNIRHQLRLLHDSGGASLVETELRERAVSSEMARRNGWRTATYYAFAGSQWFCDGGFGDE